MSSGKPDLHLVDGTRFDKEAPAGPPTEYKRQVPPHLKKIEAFFESLAADEGLLLDICLDRAMTIVKWNCDKRRVGADFFADGGGGGGATPEGVAALSAPLAVELYKQTLESVKDRADEYRKLLEEAASGQKPASILVP